MCTRNLIKKSFGSCSLLGAKQIRKKKDLTQRSYLCDLKFIWSMLGNFRLFTKQQYHQHSFGVCVHLIEISPIITFLLALFWSPPTPERNDWFLRQNQTMKL